MWTVVATVVCTSALLFSADDMYKRMPKDGKTVAALRHWSLALL